MVGSRIKLRGSHGGGCVQNGVKRRGRGAEGGDESVLQLRRDGSPKLSPPYDDPSDLDVFRAALITTIWKMNRGMAIDTGAWSELDEAA